ncbi:MAG: hypothetical protein E7632_08165 [Ruminococcaceae bacterium]|nr:hypothetical protein [Oscillospiraceae bacterium]
MFQVEFLGHRISKLIVGDNPFNGHSYITDKTTGAEMMEFYTASKILETLFAVEESGINCMLPLADPFIIRLLAEYERAGGKMKWIFQPYMPMNQNVSMRQMLSLKNTIGIYHQGTTTDFAYESGKVDEVKARIESYHSMGIPVGLGTHRPDVVKLALEEDWNVDFLVTCMYNGRRHREGEPSGFLTGKTKENLSFYACDPPIMLKTLEACKKPIIAYKLFAGGQMFLGKSPEEIRACIKNAYNTVFSALKPGDIGAIGIFQRDKDELREDVELLDEWHSEQYSKK